MSKRAAPIHYVFPNDPCCLPAACGIWPLEHLDHRVTCIRRLVTCARCKRKIGLAPRRPAGSRRRTR